MVKINHISLSNHYDRFTLWSPEKSNLEIQIVNFLNASESGKITQNYRSENVNVSFTRDKILKNEIIIPTKSNYTSHLSILKH